MFGVYFKNQKGSVMKKVLSKIFVIFGGCKLNCVKACS